MKIWLNKNYEIKKEENRNFGKGNNNFDKIIINVETESIASDNSIPTLLFETAGGRKYGPIIHTGLTTIEDVYTVFNFSLSDAVLSEKGRMAISIVINFYDNTNKIVKTKNTTTYGNVLDSVVVDGGIYLGNDTQIKSAIDAIKEVPLSLAKLSNDVNTDLGVMREELASSQSNLNANLEAVNTSLNNKFNLYTPLQKLNEYYSKTEVDAKSASLKTVLENYSNTKITEALTRLIDNSPEALDTLKEISVALGNDPNFATTITNLINEKYSSSKAYTNTKVEEAKTEVNGTIANLNTKVENYKLETNEHTDLEIARVENKVDNIVGITGEVTTLQGVLVQSKTYTDTEIAEVNTKVEEAKTYADNKVATAISNLINNSPEALDTLKELSDALGNDPNFATTITNLITEKYNATQTALATKVNKAGDTMTGQLNCPTLNATTFKSQNDKFNIKLNNNTQFSLVGNNNTAYNLNDISNLKDREGSAQYCLPNGASGWVYFGEMTMYKVSGDSVIFTLLTGAGFNGRGNQNDYIQIFVKQGFTLNTSETSFGVSVQGVNLNPEFQVIVKSNNSYQFRLYAYLPYNWGCTTLLKNGRYESFNWNPQAKNPDTDLGTSATDIVYYGRKKYMHTVELTPLDDNFQGMIAFSFIDEVKDRYTGTTMVWDVQQRIENRIFLASGTLTRPDGDHSIISVTIHRDYTNWIVFIDSTGEEHFNNVYNVKIEEKRNPVEI